MAINVKRLLANSLLELIEEKPLSKITITDIITRAGAGRQTFYNHFCDKNDLIYWIFLRTLSGEKKLLETAGFFAYLSKLYREAQKCSRFLMQACKLDGQNSLSEAITLQTYNYYKEYIMEHYGADVFTDKLEFALAYYAHGASSLYVRWAEAGTPGSAEEQARYVLHCMPQCIKEFLPLSAEERAF
jgi:AcrR family transcriptional regulator